MLFVDHEHASIGLFVLTYSVWTRVTNRQAYILAYLTSFHLSPWIQTEATFFLIRLHLVLCLTVDTTLLEPVTVYLLPRVKTRRERRECVIPVCVICYFKAFCSMNSVHRQLCQWNALIKLEKKVWQQQQQQKLRLPPHGFVRSATFRTEEQNFAKQKDSAGHLFSWEEYFSLWLCILSQLKRNHTKTKNTRRLKVFSGILSSYSAVSGPMMRS